MSEEKAEMCVSCEMVRPSARLRECGCVRCDVCVREYSGNHQANFHIEAP